MNMDTVTVKDRQFTLSIESDKIQQVITTLATRMNSELAGKKPLFLGVLNGSFMFAADLFRQIDTPAEISFVKMASYQGISSTGVVKQLIGMPECVAGRCIVIVEDIVDSGRTIERMCELLEEQHPAEIYVCTLFLKPGSYKGTRKIDYVAMELPNDFIVGYGLDYDGWGRNLPHIYTVVD